MKTTNDSNFAVALKGETLTSIDGLKEGSEEVIFKTKSGRTFRMFHSQDCCESVRVVRCHCSYWFQGTYDAGFDVKDATEKIETVPASESATRTTFQINPSEYPGAFIEWLGESNGYYSESVSFVEVVAVT